MREISPSMSIKALNHLIARGGISSSNEKYSLEDLKIELEYKLKCKADKMRRREEIKRFSNYAANKNVFRYRGV